MINFEALAADDTERALLGSIFLKPQLVATVARAGGREAFYREQHRVLYDAMLRLYQQSGGFDQITVITHLEDRGELARVGGPTYVASVGDHVPWSGHAKYYLDTLDERRRLRRWAMLGTNIVLDVKDGKTSRELASEAGRAIREIGTGSGGVTMADSAVHTWDYLAEVIEGKRTPYHSTNVGWLDHVLGGGLAPGHSYYLGGLYKAGKSKMAAFIARQMLVQGWSCEWWSVEMSHREMTQRFASCHAGVPESRLVSGKLDEVQLRKAHRALFEDLPRWDHRHHHNGKPNVYDIAAETAAKLATMDDDRLLLVVDYLQNCQTGQNLRGHEEIAEASQALNAISKDLQIPILVVYQLAPGKVEGRTEGDFTPTPKPSDARGSSQIMMDANHLVTIHRPWFQRKDRISRFTVFDRGLARGGVSTTAYLYADLNLNTYQPWDDLIPKPFEKGEDAQQPWML